MSDYDTDFYAWAQQQAQALRAKDWGALDLKHLAEEVEDLRKTERRGVRSQLRLILSTVSHKFVSGILLAITRRRRWPCDVPSL
jgi:hypothetical protein